MNRTSKFDLYRYQILPIKRYIQFEFFKEKEYKINSIEDLIKSKNEIFANVIKKIKFIEYKNNHYKFELLIEKNNVFHFKLAPKRQIKRENESFQLESIDHWPSINIIIDNHPDKQLLLIEDKKSSFSNTLSVVHILEFELNRKLEEYNLVVHIEPIFKVEYFWEIVKKYKDKIKRLEFDLITPNMANISESLSEELKLLAKTTNTAKTDLALNAEKKSSLVIDEKNKFITDLLNYASKGGGEVSIEVQGLKRKIKTSKSTQSIEIDKLLIETHSFDKILELIKSLLK
ncbi:hypothetical protein [Caminibacter pacificus]